MTFPSKNRKKRTKFQIFYGSEKSPNAAGNKNTKFTFFPFFASLRDSTSPVMQKN
jgi:hypothetical protein